MNTPEFGPQFSSDHEKEENLHGRIGIATATYYPKWYPTTEENDTAAPSVDKIRGDLALETIAEIKNGGYKGVVVDGGSSAAFLAAAEAIGVTIEAEEEEGMSASRRQAFAAVSKIPGVEAICWTEPEKVSMVRDCIDGPAQMVLDGETDIVVPTRDNAGLQSYPDYQVKFEQQSNKLWNGILRRHDLMSDDSPDLDAWIGPRIFKNTPEMLELFQRKYQFASDVHNGLPKDSDIFREKRAYQQKTILVSTIHLIRLLEEAPGARLERF